jgi:hypothetical protein
MTFRRSRLVLFICIYERYNLGLLQVGIGLGIKSNKISNLR